MALTNTPQVPRLGKLFGGGSLPVLHGVEGATQTWKLGAFLINASGKLIQATTPVNGTNTTLGIANAAATGVTSADTQFTPISFDTLIEITLSDATAGTHTLAQTDQFLAYVITKDSVSGIWYLDANTVTGGFGIVVGFKDAIGTVDARVYMIVGHVARATAAAVVLP